MNNKKNLLKLLLFGLVLLCAPFVFFCCFCSIYIEQFPERTFSMSETERSDTPTFDFTTKKLLLNGLERDNQESGYQSALELWQIDCKGADLIDYLKTDMRLPEGEKGPVLNVNGGIHTQNVAVDCIWKIKRQRDSYSRPMVIKYGVTPPGWTEIQKTATLKAGCLYYFNGSGSFIRNKDGSYTIINSEHENAENIAKRLQSIPYTSFKLDLERCDPYDSLNVLRWASFTVLPLILRCFLSIKKIHPYYKGYALDSFALGTFMIMFGILTATIGPNALGYVIIPWQILHWLVSLGAIYLVPLRFSALPMFYIFGSISLFSTGLILEHYWDGPLAYCQVIFGALVLLTAFQSLIFTDQEVQPETA